MNTDRIFVREYLETLTEKNELNVIFAFLLESMEFSVLSKPRENIGLKEFGKDFIAVGKDSDGIKKKFYFELKGGEERDITEATINKSDGIISSINDAAFIDYNSAYPEFKELPLKIVIVHNGIVRGNASNLIEGFLLRMKKSCPEIEFARWGIDELSQLFSKNLFGPYLLSNDETRKNLNRVLINLDSIQEVSWEFKELIRDVLHIIPWSNKQGKIPRQWVLKFETIKLIGFIIYTESVALNNLGLAEKYVRQILIDFCHWLLKNKLENRSDVKKYFDEIYKFYMYVLTEYISRVLPIALKKDGLYYPNGGAYEQIGYTLRTHDFISLILFGLNDNKESEINNTDVLDLIYALLKQNSVSRRPLLDINSLPILDVVLFFHKYRRVDLSIEHIRQVFAYIKLIKENGGRIPDASNNPENLVKLFATGEKPVNYVDSTSPLLGMLAELTVVFNLENDFNNIRDFAIEKNIDLVIFVPHHGEKSISRNLIEDKENDLEEQLFSKSFQDGYQTEIQLIDTQDNKLSFNEFKNQLKVNRNEFTYQYRIDIAGYRILRDLAHFHFKTPYFPDKWRYLLD